MGTLVLFIMVFIAILLVLAVLLQSSKGEGLAGSIAGGQSIGSTFGARKTADFLSKITWWLGGSLLALCIIYNMYFLPGQTTAAERESIIQSSSQDVAPTAPSLPQPTEAKNEEEADTEQK